MGNYIKWKIAQFFELIWWKNLNYSTNGKYLDQKTSYFSSIQDKINQVITPDKTDFVLDIGCGPSGFYMNLENKVDAVDSLINSYEKWISFFSKQLYPNVKFHSTPFESYATNNKYDSIYSFNAINHFNDMSKSVLHMHDLLNDNGYLIIGVDVHKSNLAKTIFRIFQFDILHPYQLDNDDYLTLFEEKGFQLLHFETIKEKKVFNYCLYIFQKN